MAAGRPVRVLFVCMGHICRSPTAEGVMRDLVRAEGLDRFIQIASAGTHDYHVGRPPDARALRAAEWRGYDLSTQRARLVTAADFESFDYLLAMDRENLARLKQIAPPGLGDKASLFLDHSRAHRGEDVPDPYTGNADNFAHVLDLVEEGTQDLLDAIKEKLSIRG
jgi:protein-tyrosine phosphatase